MGETSVRYDVDNEQGKPRQSTATGQSKRGKVQTYKELDEE